VCINLEPLQPLRGDRTVVAREYDDRVVFGAAMFQFREYPPQLRIHVSNVGVVFARPPGA